jgi:hypothetical protein
VAGKQSSVAIGRAELSLDKPHETLLMGRKHPISMETERQQPETRLALLLPGESPVLKPQGARFANCSLFTLCCNSSSRHLHAIHLVDRNAYRTVYRGSQEMNNMVQETQGDLPHT